MKLRVNVQFQLEVEAKDSDAAEDKVEDQMDSLPLPKNYVTDSLEVWYDDSFEG